MAATGYRRVAGPDVVASFTTTAAHYGLPPSNLTGNGSVYASRFTHGHNDFERLLARIGITQKNGHSTPSDPTAPANAAPRRHLPRPLPAGPTDTPAGTHWRVRTDHVDRYGKITLRHAGHLLHIGIGHRSANTPVHMLIADLNIRIIATTTGQLIRELTLDTSRDYPPQKPKTPPATN